MSDEPTVNPSDPHDAGESSSAASQTKSTLSPEADARPSDTTVKAMAGKVFHPGQIVDDNIEIVRFITSAGMGEVYLAREGRTDLVIKVIRTDNATNEAWRTLFKSEATMLRGLHHGAIVPYYQELTVGEGGQIPALVMQYVPGTTLDKYIREEGAIPLQRLYTMFGTLADALEVAHSRGVVHRDMSPDNVILRNDRPEDPVIIDFGIAVDVGEGEGLVSQHFTGKFGFAAPEQFGMHGATLNGYTDIYALGLAIIYAARGKKAVMVDHTLENQADKMRDARARREDIPDLSGVPEVLHPLLRRMLEPDPARRCASMGEVRIALADLRRGNELDGWTGGGKRQREPSRALEIICGAVALAATVAIAAILLLGQRDPQGDTVETDMAALPDGPHAELAATMAGSCGYRSNDPNLTIESPANGIELSTAECDLLQAAREVQRIQRHAIGLEILASGDWHNVALTGFEGGHARVWIADANGMLHAAKVNVPGVNYTFTTYLPNGTYLVIALAGTNPFLPLHEDRVPPAAAVAMLQARAHERDAVIGVRLLRIPDG